MCSAAAGWYTDADNAALIRWWDGSAWTEHTQPNPVAPPVVFPPPVAAPSTPVPPPFATAVAETVSPPVAETTAAPVAANISLPPAADAVPTRRDTRGSGSPSFPISEPVRLVPPTSNSFPISEPVRLVPPTSPVVESPTASWSSTEPPRSTEGNRGTFALAPLATVPPAPASAATPWTSSPTLAQPTGSVDLASVDYEPMTRTWAGPRGSSAQRTVTGVSTGGVWMLAISPLVFLGLLALGWAVTEGGTSAATTAVLSGMGGAFVAWIVVAAVLDFRRLGALGHDYRPSVFWLLLSPLLYLVSRAIHVQRTTGRGAAPTWVHAALSVVVAVAIGAAGLAMPREASITELRQVESMISADMMQQGLDYTVLCPDSATLGPGSTFVCTAYDEVGPVALLRVTYGGVPGSFTYAVEASSGASS